MKNRKRQRVELERLFTDSYLFSPSMRRKIVLSNRSFEFIDHSADVFMEIRKTLGISCVQAKEWGNVMRIQNKRV